LAKAGWAKRAKQLGWIPQSAQLTPRPTTLASWDSIPDDEKPFQRRLMEVFAGFTEHADVQVGRIVNEIDRLGYGQNTLILYIWGDNDASAEGQNGTISELLAQNGIPTTTKPADQGARRTRWPRRARLTKDRQHVSRRLGLGWQHTVPGDQAHCLTLRRHTEPSGRALSRED
jgi:arylsulfatase A-like enzyme